MKRSNEPSKRGRYIVTSGIDAHKRQFYVAAPAGWFRLSDGSGYQWDGSKGDELTTNREDAYGFSRLAASRCATNCNGKVIGPAHCDLCGGEDPG